VVVLPKSSLPFRGGGDARILVRIVQAGIHRALEDRPASGTEYALELAHSAAIVIDVFEHVIAKHDVERLVIERNRLNVHLDAGF
jgi:hypothetical protein